MNELNEVSMTEIALNARAVKVKTNKGALAQRNAFEYGKRAAKKGLPLKFSKTLNRVIRAAFRKGWHTAKRAQS